MSSGCSFWLLRRILLLSFRTFFVRELDQQTSVYLLQVHETGCSNFLNEVTESTGVIVAL